MSTKYNSNPSEASRPFDSGRDGFVCVHVYFHFTFYYLLLFSFNLFLFYILLTSLILTYAAPHCDPHSQHRGRLWCNGAGGQLDTA